MSDSQRYRRVALLVAAAAIVGAAAPAASGQAVFDNNFVPTGAGNWNLQANWFDQVNGIASIPDGTMFDDRANILSGGTANVQTPNPPPPGAVVIQNGTVAINSGATLTTVVSINQLLDGSAYLNAGANQTATLNVMPGGTLTMAGPLLSAANAANNVILGGAAAGTATVNVPAASLGGTTRVFPNAAFTSAGSVTFGAGVYNAEINGASSAMLSIGQNAILGGTLNANFTGAAPAVGASWPLLQADSVVNGFDAVTSSLTLPANQRFMTRVVPVAGNRQRLDLELAEVLVLNVNRDSGVASISHPGGSTISLDSYTVASSQGRLAAGSWNSLADQGALGGSWNEATANANSISELRPGGNGSATGGANVSLGAIYNSLAGTFAANVADVSFQYSDSAGRIVNGVVNYTGTKLNNLLLQVDPATGQARLRNTSNTTVDIDGYVISSTASLTPAGWTSLDDQNAAGGDWLEFLNPSAAQLGEVKTLGATTIAPQASFNLGAVFNPAAARDVSFEFLQAGQTEATLGAVVYEAIGDADFDNDNDVDGADFLRWQRGLGINSGATNAQGDANGDGAVNAADLTLWRSQFGQTAAAGAASAVPEPAAGVMAALCGSGLLRARRRGLRRLERR